MIDRASRIVPIIVAAALLQGISAHGAAADDEAVFEELCRTKAGAHVYETVKNVRGILDEVSETICQYCEYGLTLGGYDFVEYQVTEKVPPDHWIHLYVDGPGLYRFTLEEANHPNCRRFYERWRPRVENGLGLPDEFKGKCVATWPIEKVSAKYKIKEIVGRGVLAERIAHIHRVYATVDETKIFAEHYFFKYIPKDGMQSPVTGQVYGTRSCPAPGEIGSLKPRPYDVLVSPGYQAPKRSQK